MEFETYADVIDAYNADDMGYSSLTDYIKDQNIKIKEIDMDPMGDFEKILGKKDGGMMIAIEQLGKGGITGGKTYHQYHDQFVPPDSESERYANGGGVGSMMQPKKKKFVEQDGYDNYIKNSDSVTVPRRFKSRENATPTKLAYITAAEAKMLKKQNKGTPHKGPSGIPSYDSFDAKGNYTSGTAMSAMETGSQNARDRAEIRASTTYGGPKGLAPGVKSKAEQEIRNAAIVAGAGQRVNPGFFDSRNTISPYELAMAKASNPKLFNKVRGTGGIMGFLRTGGLFGNLLRGLGQKFGLGKTYDQPTYDMSEFNQLGLGGIDPFANLDIRDKFNRTNNTNVIDKKPRVNVNIKDSMNEDYGIFEPPPTGIMKDSMNEDYGIFEPPLTGIMKAGGYPGDYGVVPFDPGMGAVATGTVYPGASSIQDQFPVRSDFLVDIKNNQNIKVLPAALEAINAMPVDINDPLAFEKNYFDFQKENLNNPEFYDVQNDFTGTNLRVDASKNKNQELLENVINKDMYEKNLEPAFDNQNKKKNILEQMLLEESTLT
jgi:hypothetical protein